MKYFLHFLFLSSLFCNNNLSLINDLYYSTVWDSYDINEKKQEIFIGNSYKKDKEYIKIQQLAKFDKQRLFSIIKNINSYNQIISNKKISTKLINSENDTLYGHQLITNMIPFVKNREYIFKMYMIDENRLDWILLKNDNILFSEYLDKENNILTYGAGSWEIQNDSLLSFRIYVDDEVKLPNSIIRKIRINSIVSTFNDLMENLKKEN